MKTRLDKGQGAGRTEAEWERDRGWEFCMKLGQGLDSRGQSS